MKLVIIAALDRDRVIGMRGKVPWDLPEDRARFRRLTMGTAVLMGRTTHLSIGGALDGRRHVVLTSQPINGIETYTSIPDALRALASEACVHVIGGGSVFRQMLAFVDEWELTLVDGTHEGDTYFPPYEDEVGRSMYLHHEERREGFRYCTYRRLRSAPQRETLPAPEAQ